MVKTEKMLREECMLPEDIKLFVSTSRNKEGINIKNKDFSYMIVEAHNQSDVVQMAGRVRYGIDELYIVLDAKQFELTSWKLESNFAATEIAFKNTATREYSGAANDYLKEICRKSGLPVFNNKQAEDNVYTHKELKAYIEYIEKTFDFGERTISAGISYGSYSDGRFSNGSGYGSSHVSVVQNIYSEAKTAADLMQAALYQQERAVLLGV